MGARLKAIPSLTKAENVSSMNQENAEQQHWRRGNDWVSGEKAQNDQNISPTEINPSHIFKVTKGQKVKAQAHSKQPACPSLECK